jgi:acetolactate synthase-1/3 small subunit
LFSARAYNIESLSVAPTEDATVSRLTLVTSGTPEIIEQITKQLNKLIDVIRLVELEERRSIESELMLIKLRAAGGEQREELKRLIDIFGGRIVDVTESTYTVEMVGDGDKLNAFIEVVSTKRILEVIRSGVLGILRGTKALRA